MKYVNSHKKWAIVADALVVVVMFIMAMFWYIVIP